ncbi:MAG: hypothetical protein ACP5N7_03615 [Candidatus Pacearchaeota archaeon]
MKIVLILMKIFVIGALLIISNQGLALGVSENRAEFIQDYGIWVNHLFQKTMSIASYVIKNEWLPETGID